MPKTIPAPITTTVWRVEVACILCARVSGYVQDGHVQAAAPEYADEVARLRCPFCGGRLVTHGEAYPVRFLRPLTEQEQRPSKRGRPPKAKAQALQLAPSIEQRKRGPCARWPRLIDVLADGLSRDARELCAALSISRGSLRRFIHVARCAGYPIQGGRDSRRIGVYTLVLEATG